MRASVGVFPAAVLFAAHALTALDLSHRRLTELPDAIGGLRSLAYLAVAGNRLSRLPALALPRLGKLQELHADENELEAFPPLACLAPLARLRVLGLSRNGLAVADVPIGLVSALPELVELRI